jgi:hypothetical protein
VWGALLHREVVDVAVRALAEALEQLLLYVRLDVGRAQRFRLAVALALLDLLVHANKLRACLQGELAHAYQILRDFGEALLALVHHEVRPVLELVINLLERCRVVF